MLREELVKLAGDPLDAILLNYFLNARLKDPFKFVECSAKKISQESLLNLPKNTLYDHLKHLIARGWLNVERRPGHSNGYKVILSKVLSDLHKLGYEDFSAENLDCEDWLEEIE